MMEIKRHIIVLLVTLISLCLILGCIIAFILNQKTSIKTQEKPNKKFVDTRSFPAIKEIHRLNKSLNAHKQNIICNNAKGQIQSIILKSIFKPNIDESNISAPGMLSYRQGEPNCSNKQNNERCRAYENDIIMHSGKNHSEMKFIEEKFDDLNVKMISKNFSDSKMDGSKNLVSTNINKDICRLENSIQDHEQIDVISTVNDNNSQFLVKSILNNDINNTVCCETNSSYNTEGNNNITNNDIILQFPKKNNVDKENDDKKISQSISNKEPIIQFTSETYLNEISNRCVIENKPQEVEIQFNNSQQLCEVSNAEKTSQTTSPVSNIANIATENVIKDINLEDIISEQKIVPLVRNGNQNKILQLGDMQNKLNQTCATYNVLNDSLVTINACQKVVENELPALCHNTSIDCDSINNKDEELHDNKKEILVQESNILKLLCIINDDTRLLQKKTPNRINEIIYVPEVADKEYTQSDIQKGVKKYKHCDQNMPIQGSKTLRMVTTMDDQNIYKNKIEDEENYSHIMFPSITSKNPIEESKCYQKTDGSDENRNINESAEKNTIIELQIDPDILIHEETECNYTNKIKREDVDCKHIEKHSENIIFDPSNMCNNTVNENRNTELKKPETYVPHEYNQVVQNSQCGILHVHEQNNASSIDNRLQHENSCELKSDIVDDSNKFISKPIFYDNDYNGSSLFGDDYRKSANLKDNVLDNNHKLVDEQMIEKNDNLRVQKKFECDNITNNSLQHDLHGSKQCAVKKKDLKTLVHAIDKCDIEEDDKKVAKEGEYYVSNADNFTPLETTIIGLPKDISVDNVRENNNVDFNVFSCNEVDMTNDIINNSNLEKILVDNKGQKVTGVDFTLPYESADNFNNEDNANINNKNVSIINDTIEYETNILKGDTKTTLCMSNINFKQEKENLSSEDIKPLAASTCAEKVQSTLEMLKIDSLNKASNFADSSLKQVLNDLNNKKNELDNLIAHKNKLIATIKLGDELKSIGQENTSTSLEENLLHAKKNEPQTIGVNSNIIDDNTKNISEVLLNQLDEINDKSEKALISKTKKNVKVKKDEKTYTRAKQSIFDHIKSNVSAESYNTPQRLIPTENISNSIIDRFSDIRNQNKDKNTSKNLDSEPKIKVNHLFTNNDKSCNAKSTTLNNNSNELSHYHCWCTNKEVGYNFKNFDSENILKYYKKIGTPKKTFIIIDIVQGSSTESTIDLGESELKLLKTYINQMVQFNRCKHNELFSFHLSYIINNVFKFQVIPGNKLANTKRLWHRYTYDNNVNLKSNNYEPNTRYQCAYTGFAIDIYISFLKVENPELQLKEKESIKNEQNKTENNEKNRIENPNMNDINPVENKSKKRKRYRSKKGKK